MAGWRPSLVGFFATNRARTGVATRSKKQLGEGHAFRFVLQTNVSDDGGGGGGW